MNTISNISDPRISEFKSLRDSHYKNSNQLIAESEKVVLKLLKSSLSVFKILATESFFKKHKKIIDSTVAEQYVATKDVLQGIVGHNLHHGIIALGKRPDNALLEQLKPPIMVLNGLVSAENVGAVVRNCAAFGVNSLLCDSKTCSPYIRRAIRVSMGNIFAMTVRETSNLQRDLKTLQNQKIKIISTANIEKAQSLTSFKNESQNYAVVIGNEGYGIDQDILELSNCILKIPIDENVAAVNAACASAIFLYAMTQ